MAVTVRLGVVGAGRIACDHLKAITGLQNVEVAGITSRTMTKAQDLGAQFAIPVVTESLSELVQRTRPDGLLLLVSVDQIYHATCAAFEYGIPLFLEKPPGLTPTEAYHLEELARQYQIGTMVGYNRRYFANFHQGIRIIRDHGPLMGILVEGHERLAKVRSAGFHPQHVLNNWVYANATHTIDLLRFFGGELKEFYPVAHSYQETLGDQFAAVATFSSGTMGTYVSHWLSPGGWRVVLCGNGVTVEFKPLEAGLWTDRTLQAHEIEADPCDLQYRPGFFRQMEAFCDLIRDGKLAWPGQDLAGACETMRVAEQLVSAVRNRAGKD